MKTAVSIPDEVFAAAERLLSRLKLSRSKLYARALAEFVARHDDDQITVVMNEAVREAAVDEAEADNAFSRKAATQVIQRAEW